ncbi:MAG: PD-(D/E)XK nuclease family protein [Alphaproteobacteria bacterium]|nr:PD-(D/E)XK nuclease family protein [Alphaproteobacteria bacterium]
MIKNCPLEKNILSVFVTGYFPFSPTDLVFVPTMRAKRVLADLILDAGDKQACLLPRILSFDEAGRDPVLSHSQESLSSFRQFELLFKLIETRFPNLTFSQKTSWTDQLLSLVNKMTLECLSFSDLEKIVPEELNNHYQKTLDFLSLLYQAWPKILKEEGLKTGSQNQVEGILYLAQRLSQYEGRVFGLGSTGSLPATRELLKSIHQHKNGIVYLHGYDPKIQEEVSESHPQYGFQNLLKFFEAERVEEEKVFSERERFLHHALSDNFDEKVSQKEVDHIMLAVSESQYHEAMSVAKMIQKRKEKKGLLVTTNRDFVQRLKAVLPRFGLIAEDSAGEVFFETSVGHIISAYLAFLKEDSPQNFLRLFSLVKPVEEVSEAEEFLRNTRPNHLFTEIRHHIPNETGEKILEWIAFLVWPLESENTFDKHLENFEEKCHYLIQDFDFSFLKKEGKNWHVSGKDFLSILAYFLEAVPLRTPFNKEADILILGPIEARMQKADYTIIPSLNEDSFPKISQDDPFMNDPMREAIGLPIRKRKVGLMALDFIHLLTAKEVILSRAKFEEGAPTVESRFLQKVKLLAEKNGCNLKEAPEVSEMIKYDKGKQQVDSPVASFAPPLHARPIKLSVSAIEMWLRDPYAFYAKYILKLYEKDDFETDDMPRIFGNVIHEGLEKLAGLDDFSEDTIRLVFEQLIQSENLSLDQKLFWTKKAEKIASFVADYEKNKESHKRIVEVSGACALTDNFEIRAKADRLNVFQDGTIEVMDYKTGALPKPKDLMSGLSPQMPLEAYIVENGGFKEISGEVSRLTYLRLGKGKDSDDKGEERVFKEIPEILEATLVRLKTHILAYEKETQAYTANREDAKEKYKAYTYLERI